MKKVREIRQNVPSHWVGDGFPVRSLFSYQEGSRFDPFLLLDYAGPHTFSPAEAQRGVGEHPHRGFETVTIVYQGELEHHDSSGSHGVIGAGDVQWMTAAGGILHQEYHSERFAREGGTLEMVQLWVNLPAKDKGAAPGYQSLLADQIPVVDLPGGAGRARVIAGDLAGTRGAARTFTPINVWDLQLKAGTQVELALPASHHATLVVQHGRLAVQGDRVEGVALVVFEEGGDALNLVTETAARVLVLSGEPIGEPVVGRGPFVMNSAEEIREAIADFQAGRMGRMPG